MKFISLAVMDGEWWQYIIKKKKLQEFSLGRVEVFNQSLIYRKSTQFYLSNEFVLCNYLWFKCVIMINLRHSFFVSMIWEVAEGWKWVIYFSLGPLAGWGLSRSMCGSTGQRARAHTWIHLCTKLQEIKQQHVNGSVWIRKPRM